MKNLIIFLVLILISSANTTGQNSFRLKNSQVSILGTSSLHDWESDVTKVNANGNLVIENGILKDIRNLKVEIPVEGIKSSKGNIMNKKTYSALKMEEHPLIVFQLGKIKSISPEGGKYLITAEGDLHIAGTRKTVELKVTGKKLSDDEMQFTGEKSLTMTSFNVEPPTAMMGTLKTGDEVTIRFNITLSAPAENNAGSD